MLASAPLFPKFVSNRAAMYHELRKRGTRKTCRSIRRMPCRALGPTSPRLRGEVDLRAPLREASRVRGQFPKLGTRGNAPLTRIPSLRSESDLSPQAGRGEN